MALDAAMLYVTAKELEERLVGARVEKLYMPTRDEVLFLLRTPQGNQKMLVSARSGSARVHITTEEFENPATPPSFCMLLRKYLGSGRITGIRAVDSERIILMTFDSLNEMGDRVEITASLEMMGRYSNFVLVNAEGRIIDALKRIDAEQSDKRQLLPGLEFTMPPAQDKLPFLDGDIKELVTQTARRSKPLSLALLDCVAGIGPVVCREIARRVDCSDPDADALTDEQRKKLEQEIARVRKAARGDGRYLSIIYDGKRPVEFSFTELAQYGDMEAVTFDTASELFDRYYAEKDRADRAKTRSFDLTRQVNSLIERVQRKLGARLQEQKDTGKAEQKKLYGEIITANLHALEKGMESAELLDYYTGETVRVSLDKSKTPAQNAQKYYKDYRKLTTAASMLESLINSGYQELEYLESVRHEITEARTEEDFLLIRKELKEAGYLRGFKYKEQKNTRRMSEFVKYKTTSGKTVLAGRNNAANDKLTMKTADKRDYWFHVKNEAGSHVVLETAGQEPDDRDYIEAAMIAVLHSSQKGNEKVPVDYTLVKNVKKPTGARAGMVTYEGYYTVNVTADKKEIERLCEQTDRRAT